MRILIDNIIYRENAFEHRVNCVSILIVVKKKLLIVSDSHGNFVNLRKAVEIEFPFDYLIHCGDGIRDIAQVELPGGIVVVKVAGNIESYISPGTEKIEIFEVSGTRIMVTHGDQLQAHHGMDGVLREAVSRGADLVFYGHTHKKALTGSRPLLFNPGPLSNGSYGTAFIGDTLELHHRKL